MKNGTEVTARKVLLATGVVDQVPDYPGMRACYGKSVFHCPYCDGWEVRNTALAVFARGNAGAAYTLTISLWGSSVVLCTNGAAGISAKERARLAKRNIAVDTRRIAALMHTKGRLRAVRFTKGEPLAVTTAFFNSSVQQHCDLAVELGCRTQHQGIVVTDRKQRTGVDGVFVAGDAAMGTHFVSVAAAEGAKAGVAINTELLAEDLDRPDA